VDADGSHVSTAHERKSCRHGSSRSSEESSRQFASVEEPRSFDTNSLPFGPGSYRVGESQWPRDPSSGAYRSHSRFRGPMSAKPELH